MTTDLQRAKTLLENHNYTCVLCRGETIITSTKRGVKPLVDMLDGTENLNGFSAADKIVGKAAAVETVLTTEIQSLMIQEEKPLSSGDLYALWQ